MEIMDIIGTVAFAISGVMVAAEKKMDLFGVWILAVVTATGGGMCRDIIVGNLPPILFRDPKFVIIASATALILFIFMKKTYNVPKGIEKIYEKTLFFFDTVGLAVFTIDGINVGIKAGFSENIFLLVFLGMVTGTGGGLLCDLLAGKTPAIFHKKVYATASIIGGLATVLLFRSPAGESFAILAGMIIVMTIRFLAYHFEWNLPRL